MSRSADIERFKPHPRVNQVLLVCQNRMNTHLPLTRIVPKAFIWCWAFRPLAEKHLRSCLLAFESSSSSSPVFRVQLEKATFRLLPDGKDSRAMAPVSMIVYFLDTIPEVAGRVTFTQELLEDHSIRKSSCVQQMVKY